MTEIQLAGSGGWVNADLTDEQITKSKLIPNMDKHFLASLEKLDTTKMIKHFCKQCNSEFNGPTQIQIEEKRVNGCVHNHRNHVPHYLEIHYLHIWNISLIPLEKRS